MFDIVLCDPPWKYDNEKSHNPKWGGKTYKTMSLEELKNLRVKGLWNKDCYMFMWVTLPKIPEGLILLREWGFEYKTVPFVWFKLNPTGKWCWVKNFLCIFKGFYSGMGHFTNGNIELIILGRKGKSFPRLRKDIKQIILAPRGRHLEKPQEVKERIVQLLGDRPRLEMFARERLNDGWKYHGLEIYKPDIEIGG